MIQFNVLAGLRLDINDAVVDWIYNYTAKVQFKSEQHNLSWAVL